MRATSIPPQTAQREILFLLVAAAVLFSANTYRLSLLPLDDCFYARKGVEMLQRGFSFTVTWNGHPNYQNPPLPFWLLGTSFAIFGENDFAARLPSLLMALGLLLLTARIGALLLGRDAAIVGVAMLLLCPLFVSNARRCMLEIQTAFWVVLALDVGLESRRRRRLAVWVALPLAAGLLTKSLLGLLPLVILGAFALHQEGRRVVANPWLWAGIALGLLGGATWTIQQGLTAGWDAVRAHYLGEVGGRALGTLKLTAVMTEYPRALVQEFQPVVIPGCIAAVLALRRARSRADGARVFLAVWTLVPVLVLSFSSARSSRYIFSILVPLSLLTADLFVSWKYRVAMRVATRVVPPLAIALATVLWLRPALLTRDLNASFKAAATEIQDLVPAGSAVPVWDTWSWRLANPFVYYAERGLEMQPEASLQQVLDSARRLPVPCLIVPRERMSTVAADVAPVDVLADFGRWLFLVVASPGASNRQFDDALAGAQDELAR